MSTLFREMALDGEHIKALIPEKGWRTVVSINGIAAARLLSLAKEKDPESYENNLNKMIPAVMDMTESPLTREVKVVCTADDGSEETLTVPYNTVDKTAVTVALKKNFEGIIAMGKAAGFEEEDIGVLFASALMAFEKAEAADGVDMQDIMANMMSGVNPAADAAHESPEGMQQQNCPAQ